MINLRDKILKSQIAYYNGLSVLPYDGGSYTQAPFEDINKESFDKLVESGKFSDLELQRFLFDAFEEGYQRNPEKDPVYKPYKEKTKAERMADPDRGINSPAFKKFMADRGM